MNALGQTIRNLLGRNETAKNTFSAGPIRRQPSYLMLGGQITALNPHTRNVETAFKEALLGAADRFGVEDADLARAYTVGVTAFACVQVRARLVSSVPLMVTVGGQRIEENDQRNPASQFISKSATLLSQIETALSIWGKYYLHKRRNPHGYPVVLEWVNPALVRQVIDRRTGHVQEYTVGQQTVPPKDMLYSHTFNPNNPHDGVSPYEVAMQSIQTENNLMKTALSFFGNGARPDGLLVPKTHVDEDDARDLQTRWNAMFKGADNRYKTAVMPDEWDYIPITPPMDDLAAPELMHLVRTDVTSAFQVSPILIGLGNAGDPLSAQNTYRETWNQHIEYFAIPELKFILDVLNNQWLADWEQIYGAPLRIEIDHQKINAQTRATSERASTAISLYQNGLYDIDESREYLGQAPANTGIKNDPTKASILFNDGAMPIDEYRSLVGLDPLQNEVGKKFSWELQPAQATPSFGFPLLAASRGGTMPDWNKHNYLGMIGSPFPSASEVLASLKQKQQAQEAESTPEPAPVAEVEADNEEATPAPDGIPEASAETDETERALNERLDELRKWRQKQRSFRKKCLKAEKPIEPVHFECEILCSDLQTLVRTGLNDGWSYTHVFDVAEQAIRAGDIPDAPFGVAPEEFEAYWQNLDELEADLAQAWLDYVRQISADITMLLSKDPAAELTDELFVRYHNQLIEAWVGTEDAPGALQQIVLAGMAKGNDILNALVENTRAINPGWTFEQRQAYEYALEYAGRLITGLDDTTRSKINDIIAQSIQEGWTVDELNEALETVLIVDTDTPSEQVMNRARLISDSERSTAFNAGAQRRWQDAGAGRAIWQTVRDEDVCPICRPLHAQDFDLNQGIYSNTLGRYVRFTAHPRCRCFQQPDVSSINLDALLESVA